jgi:hypothetical protein
MVMRVKPTSPQVNKQLEGVPPPENKKYNRSGPFDENDIWIQETGGCFTKIALFILFLEFGEPGASAHLCKSLNYTLRPHPSAS